MKILVTGSKGFVGRNLVENLKNIKEGKNRTKPNLIIDEIYEFDKDTDIKKLGEFCKDCDFVFNLAGVNRPKDTTEFMEGNFGFASILLDTLKKYNNKCPIMISSSIQACLKGRYEGSEYGKSKLEGENLVFEYGKENNVKVFVYRFANLFGKWCRPNYNSVVATFCNNIANDLPIQVNDPNIELELIYIDDLVEEMLNALEGEPSRCNFNDAEAIAEKNGKYCYVPISHKVTLGLIVELLNKYKEQPNTLVMPNIPDNSFDKKLYSTYLSYLPKEKMIIDLNSNVDDRGSFTEILKTVNTGQFSVNISKPGITKGQHWHNSKWEFFIVVSGKALIEERKVGTDKVIRFEVSGDKIQAVHMIPGYTHNIINLSETDDLVTLMWANELFNPKKPDTYYMEV